MKSRIAAALLTFMLLGGWFDDPPSWAKPDGGPIDPDVFQHERSVCATQAAVYSGQGLLDGELHPMHEALWVRPHTPGYPTRDRTD